MRINALIFLVFAGHFRLFSQIPVPIGLYSDSLTAMVIKSQNRFVFKDSIQSMYYSKFNFEGLPAFLKNQLLDPEYKVSDTLPLKKSILKQSQAILNWCDQNGFLTAGLKIKYNILSDTLLIQWNLNRGLCYRLDSLLCMSANQIKPKFLERLLDLKIGQPINFNTIQNTATLFNNLDWIALKKPSQLYLTETQAKLFVYPEIKNTSQLEGILGLQNQSAAIKPVLTGDVNLHLKHKLFFHGEALDLKWRRIQFQTQDFQLRFQFPYVFGSTMGTDFGFQIYRRDTAFVDFKQKWGLKWEPRGKPVYAFYYSKQLATPLGSQLPDTIGLFSREHFGIQTQWNFFSKPYPYPNGMEFEFLFQTGNRYSNEFKNVNQLSTEFKYRYTMPLKTQHALYYQVLYSGMYSQRRFFANEMYRIGGFKSLRGFDEESIWCTSFGIQTVEYRWMVSVDSYLYLFCDIGFYEQLAVHRYQSDLPYSTGLGLQLKTASGIINLCYAAGSQNQSPIRFSSGKIHVGFKARF